ncbi:hypothetical protein [Thalassotalea sp. Y01]|uniref:hypothetical protein n=1 Tax=Thalassotalea sp. Y01 TaxID=2729613 RepID=UPI00145F3BDB|nr:hypothetical protein [Thalassotalea sp. Y01]NMP17942.1 hypothetical protein [Thalassotalea sp. Y01]
MKKLKTLARLSLSLMLATLVSACANQANRHITDTSHIENKSLPPISIFFALPSNKMLVACQEFENASTFNDCQLNPIDWQYYVNSFRYSNKFYEVHEAKNDVDYQLEIASTSFNKESVNVEMNLYWRNQKINSADYQLPLDRSISLLQKNSTNENVANTLVTKFISDADHQALFSATYLAQKLQSSDYEKDFQLTEKIGDFAINFKYVYTDPFLGASMRYHHQKYLSDYIDIYVYPIRRIEWQDGRDALNEEINLVRQEIEYVIGQQQNLSVTTEDNQFIQLALEHGDTQGVFFDGIISETGQEDLYTSTYVFINGDKFVKFRATFPASFSKTFVEQALPLIQVPTESHFMAKLRDEYRQKQQLDNP